MLLLLYFDVVYWCDSGKEHVKIKSVNLCSTKHWTVAFMGVAYRIIQGEKHYILIMNFDKKFLLFSFFSHQ